MPTRPRPHVDRAIGLLDEMESGGVVTPSTYSYNMLIGALVRKDIILAEDFLIRMTNTRLLPNEATMDCFLMAYVNSDQAGTGVSMMQSCFNQYGVRPSSDIFAQVMRMLLDADEKSEAERAAYVHKQLWGPDAHRDVAMAGSWPLVS